MKFIVKIFLILLFAQILYANNVNKHYFQKGNEFFHKKDYNKAVKFYEKIYKNGITNGYLFYNIGTCYLKKHNLGKSLYWYYKAKFFIPLNSSLNNNIQLAQSLKKDNLENKVFFHYIDNFFFLGKILSLKINFYLSTLLFITLILLLILKNFVINLKRKYFIKRAIVIIAVLFIIFELNFIFQYYKYNYLNIGFITSNNTQIKDDFNTKANTILTVNDGTKVFILSENENFFKIKLINGVEGWVLKNKLISKENE